MEGGEKQLHLNGRLPALEFAEVWSVHTKALGQTLLTETKRVPLVDERLTQLVGSPRWRPDRHI